jgi:hypothetical protein
MSRAKEFQINASEKLAQLKEKMSKLKRQMIIAQDEDSANALLSFEQMIDALANELKMWIALKEDDPNSAWDSLISAQYAARTAMQAHNVAEGLDGYIQRLHGLERLLFPPQMFLSSGLVIANSECSICGQEYGECEHIKGKAYMGEICSRIIHHISEVREASIVKDPADKCCRATSVSDGGVMRDVMTWREIPEGKGEAPFVET